MFLYQLKLTRDDDSVVYAITVLHVGACCTLAGAASTITVNGSTFRKNQVVSVEFGKGWISNEIPEAFCVYFTNLTHLGRLPTVVDTINNYFLAVASSFNEPVLLH